METTARKILVLALVAWMPIDSLYAASEEWISPQGEYFFQSEKASLEELDHARGREGIDVTTLNRMNVRGFVKDNSAINNTSGYNFIDNGSFVGASGMFSVIQNSGNNVLIQDSTILNITILP